MIGRAAGDVKSLEPSRPSESSSPCCFFYRLLCLYSCLNIVYQLSGLILCVPQFQSAIVSSSFVVIESSSILYSFNSMFCHHHHYVRGVVLIVRIRTQLLASLGTEDLLSSITFNPFPPLRHVATLTN